MFLINARQNQIRKFSAAGSYHRRGVLNWGAIKGAKETSAWYLQGCGRNPVGFIWKRAVCGAADPAGGETALPGSSDGSARFNAQPRRWELSRGRAAQLWVTEGFRPRDSHGSDPRKSECALPLFWHPPHLLLTRFKCIFIRGKKKETRFIFHLDFFFNHLVQRKIPIWRDLFTFCFTVDAPAMQKELESIKNPRV